MKKIYAPKAASELKRSRFSFVKVLSLATAATFLSNASPVFSANSDFRNTFLEGVESAGVSYPENIISVAGLNASSKDNYLTALNVALTPKVNAADDYANFLTKTLSGVNDYRPVVNVLTADSRGAWEGVSNISKAKNMGDQKTPQFTRVIYTNSVNIEADDVYEKEKTFNVSAPEVAQPVNKLPVVFQSRAGLTRSAAIGSVTLGKGAFVTGEASIAIGAKIDTEELGPGGGQVFYPARVFGSMGVAIGTNSQIGTSGSESSYAVAIGFRAKVGAKAKGSIALGSDSVAINEGGIAGYDPITGKVTTKRDGAWVSTQGFGALSIGDVKQGNTRQIVAVAAGTNDSDAVNVAQLKALQNSINPSWRLSVNGKNTTNVNSTSPLDLVTGSTNLNLTKGDKDNKVQFDLAQDVALTSLKAGTNTLDATGLVITDGPKITTGGIDAGSKKITGIQNGALTAESTEAVNGSQLLATNTEIKEVRDSILVKQATEMTLARSLRDGGAGLITIGKGTGGTEISILNKDSGARKLSGLLNGVVGEDSTEAITGAQLHSLGSSVASYFGGGAKYESGTWTAPTFIVKSVKEDGETENKEYSDVASAFAGVGSSITNVKKEITNQITNAKNDSLYWSEEENAFAAQHGEEKSSSKITSLANGDITSTSSDAVAGNQLHSLGSSVAKSLGGNASYADGKWTSPTFKVKTIKEDGVPEDKDYPDVASAFAGVGSSITNVQNKLTEQVNNVVKKVESESFVQQDKTTHRLTIGAAVEGSEINISNKDQGDRILSGVGEATKNNEAVNKGQLDESLKNLSDNLQSDDSAVIHYDKTGDENGSINYTSVTLGGKDKTAVGLHNVADGNISKDSRDAITGGQLNTISQEVAKFLGGNATFEKGIFKGPIYNLSSITTDGMSTPIAFTNVGAAFAGLDTNIKNVNARIKEVSQGVAQDSLNWSKTDNAFVAQHGEGEAKANSKITSLANGAISETSMDAVNGSQLHTLGTGVATSLGGGAVYKDGKWTAPTFKVKQIGSDGHITDETYQNVADAFSSVGNSFQSVHDEINTMRSDSLVKWDEKTKVIKIGGEKDGTTITIADKDSKARILSGVKDAEKSDEAVNKAQLDENVTKLSSEIKDVRSVAVFYDEEEDTEEVSTLTRSARKVNKNSVTFGDPKTGTVGLHNVGNGNIAKDSHDAINGSQLFETNDKVATYFGGGAGYNEKGEWQNPDFQIQTFNNDGTKGDKKSSNNVAGAFNDINDSMSTINARIKEVSQGVAQDSLNWSKTDNAFVAQHGEGEAKANSKITSLANGDITASSSDAVTGGQIYDLQKQFAGYLGGGAGYNEEGKWQAPTFKVTTVKEDGNSEETKYDSVAEAFAGVGSSFANIHNEINKEISKVLGDSLVKQDEKTKVINIGKEVEGASISIADKESKDRILSGVKDAEHANEAVNKGQLDKNVDKLTNEIEEVRSVAVFYDVEEDTEEVSTLTRSAPKVNKNSVTFGDQRKGQVGLHNVAAGKIAKDSHDAVNGDQLHSLGNTVATYFGGGSTFADGAFTAPTYKISNVAEDGKATEKSYNDVGSAFAGLDASVKNVNTHLTNEVKKFDDKLTNITQEVQGDALLWNESAKAFVALHGEKESKTNSKITSLADGSIVSGSSDAVTGGQLHSITDDLSKLLGGAVSFDGKNFKGLKYDLSTVSKEGVVTDKPYEGVETAFKGLDDNIKNVNARIKEVSEGVAQDSLSWSNESNAFIAQHGEEGKKTNSKITSLAAGAITKDSTDAVNGSQLFATNTEIANVRDSILVKQVAEKKFGRSLSDGGSGPITVGMETGGSEISILNKSNEGRKLSGLLGGAINETSDEAVTGSQLHTLGSSVASYFGGGAAFKDGSFTAPTYNISNVSDDGKVTTNSHNDVGSAFSDLDTSVKNVNTHLTNEVKNFTEKLTNITQEVQGDALLWNESAKAFVAKHGEKESKTNSKITSLADGSIASGSSDAVTGGQLHSITDDLSKLLGGSVSFDGKNFTGPTYDLSTVSKEGVVTDKSHTDVGSAFKGLDDNIKNVNARIKEVSEGVAQDSLLWSGDAFVAQHEKDGKKENSKIKFLAAGDITKESTEAIMGGQLYAITDDLSNLLGGAVSFDGKNFKGLQYNLSNIDKDGKVTDKSHTNVGSAFAGLDDNIKTVNARIKEVSEGVAHDSLLWSDTAHAFVAQHEKKEEKDGKVVVTQENSKITFLSAGNITKDSTDAINGSQIYSMSEMVGSYFGGGAGYNKEGKWIAPTFKVKQIGSDGHITDETYQNVADAFSRVGNSFESVHNEINTMRSGSLVKQDEKTKVIKIGGEKDGTTITVADKDSKDRILSGVKDAEKGNEAVNKAQLDKNVDALTNEINDVRSVAVFYDEEEDTEEVSTLTRSAPKAKQNNVTFGDPSKGQVGLHNVGIGKIAKDSHDAINGSQLFETNDKVAIYLGGGSAFKEGSLTAPIYKISNITDNGTVTTSSYNDVGSAFAGLDASVKNVNTHLTNEVKNFTDKLTNITQAVQGDALLWNESAKAFVAKHGEKESKTNSKITSLADGSIVVGSSDAITGGQIYDLRKQFAGYFGGGAGYNEKGEWQAPNYTLSSIDKDGKVTDKSHTNVGSAFEGLDDNIKTVNARIKEVSEGVAQDSLLWNGKAHAFVAQHEKREEQADGTVVVTQENSKITSLADGSIASGSSDAVNGGQIYDLNQSLAKYFGGDAKYDGDGWVLPGFKLMTFQEDGSFEEEDYDSIAAAFAGINKVFKNLHNEISENIEQNALLWSDDAGAFVAQHEKEGKKDNSKITFLAEGKISEDSTDAINGGQIYTLQQSFASYFGGGAGYDKEGNWQGPKFYVQVFNEDGTKGDKEERNNVSEAFDVVNDSMSTINDRIKEVEKDVASNGLNWNEEKGSYDASHADDQGVKSPSKIINVEDGKVDKDSKEAVNGGQLWETQQMITDQVKDIETKVTEGSVQYDKDETGKKTNKVTLVGGDDSSPVLIDNVADGKIEKDSKEAVNGGQLHDYTEQQMKTVLEDANKYTDEKVNTIVNNGVNEAKSYTDMKFETLSYAVEDVRKEARQAAAIGLAVSNLRYYDIPGSLSVSFGSGLWRSQSAFAIGAGYTSEDGNIRSNVSITSAGGHWGIGAGITLRLR
ncbi:YadA-like family protein [Bartonella grahamii]|nr:YadA-like family protein [Bartonella grahamii]